MTETLWVEATEWLDRARSLEADGWVGTDLCGVDRLGLGDKGSRFEAVAQLLHRGRRERLLVHVLADGDPPTVPSVTPVWPGLNFPEREAYDMFGIVFEGHPGLKRILMPDEWEGHPLRKDYGVGKVQVEFLPQPFLQIDAPGQDSSPSKAREAVDGLGQTEDDTEGADG